MLKLLKDLRPGSRLHEPRLATNLCQVACWGKPFSSQISITVFTNPANQACPISRLETRLAHLGVFKRSKYPRKRLYKHGFDQPGSMLMILSFLKNQQKNISTFDRLLVLWSMSLELLLILCKKIRSRYTLSEPASHGSQIGSG